MEDCSLNIAFTKGILSKEHLRSRDELSSTANKLVKMELVINGGFTIITVTTFRVIATKLKPKLILSMKISVIDTQRFFIIKELLLKNMEITRQKE